MLAWLPGFVASTIDTVLLALEALIYPAVGFLLLALLVKRGNAIREIAKAIPETGINLGLVIFNAILVTPVIAGIAILFSELFDAQGYRVIDPGVWRELPFVLTLFLAIFIGDFTGYWRHRLEHCRWLWPAHAVHHSDTEMTWLTLERFHPLNRLTTYMIDSAVLLWLGFPPEALLANNLVRHYYGYLIHADLPWRYGFFDRIFVSPTMHRWHHADDPRAFNTNYATVFSLFDRAFGTYRVPGPCDAPLGVSADMGQGIAGQLAYPLRLKPYRSQASQFSSGGEKI
ncbi:sterol desaturase family protein [Aestuariispira insulae]|uniref:Sterol desaturase/sphingolipid hydroxylase (Fatty acid hydroxylase superfamily) n=1 Tax=Aestuariispira insulae TaxID=1461337 RepID=A0A3D9HRW7_9PROT|nr:sterol desaturase family protein [Aestuariispira insulae]RED51606.1 sterol desaturase/sphingolipid hydroxylase (fatty acid hydroxylase superfamily) [Aestuariispira insulae]